MPKTKQKYAFHVDCVECDKHYCLRDQVTQMFIVAKHHDHTTISSLNPNECEAICNE
jgi:hypothetical protein